MPGANKTAVATVLADIDLTPPFDLNPGLNLGLNHTKNLRFKPRFKPGFFCGGFKPRFKPRVGVRCARYQDLVDVVNQNTSFYARTAMDYQQQEKPGLTTEINT